MQKLVTKYLKLEEKIKRNGEIEDQNYKELTAIEKVLMKYLRKQKKLPKSVSCIVGRYRLSVAVRLGYRLKIKKKGGR